MNITNLKKVIPLLWKHDIVAFLHGAQGVGKTQTIKQLAKEQGMGFVHLHAATQEVGDLVGLLMKREDGTAYHTRPEWMPKEGKGIIFLDELNRAHPDVIQALFSFILEKTIHTHKLPDGWKIVAAGNYQNNKFNLTDTSDAAWGSRFCHLDVKPEVHEFAIYAEERGFNFVADFAREYPALFELDKKDKLDLSFIELDRRAMLEMVGKLDSEDLGDNTFEVYSGCIGPSAAASYLAWKKKKEKVFSLNDILNNYSKVREKVKKCINQEEKETRFDLLDPAVSELLTRLETNFNFLTNEKLENLKEFLLDIPTELLMKTMKSITKLDFKGKKVLVNDPIFVEKLLQNKLNKII